jgi:hypothetical protein
MGRASDWLVTEDFVPPSGIVFREVDRMSGGLPTRACTDRITEAFLVGTEPTEPCYLHPEERVEEGPGERREKNVLRKVLDWFR